MGFGYHLLNGIVSTVISLVVTAYSAEDEPGPFDYEDVLVAIAVTAFLSGFFTSYFATE